MGRLKFAECENCGDWQGLFSGCFNKCHKPIEALREWNKYKDLEEIFLLKMTDEACDILKDKEEFAKWLDRIKWYGKKLDEYARAEEQGELLKLPCKLGDTVYALNIGFADNIVINEYKIQEVSTHRIWVDSMYYDHSDIGKTVFLTEKEAEAALAEMEK